ncbi:hypothetical protein F5B22DRAFT_641618 [Xylaria bambusicola]|uniref:uncharacterized protein n=1 Tax=Xylaria bambusicola TaxID=326684 RepID=UPI00200803FF|nr:uncharacterized protein F5B22DRAFT_641618 [Xylaria bambusicola]KAI0526474.1 hypothetical protein F5B22DRAFT_641618 [Xylaria bambusicola]
MSSIPTQVAEVIQTAHIKREPSPRHDLNPSTAASTREPAYLPSTSPGQRHEAESDDSIDADEEDEIPLSVLVRPRGAERRRRSPSFPPMPDLRFEQSYLHSIAGAETWGRVAWITVRDQFPVGFIFQSRYQELEEAMPSSGQFPWLIDWLHDVWTDGFPFLHRLQIMMPLAQGVLYNLAIVGWQHWNQNAQMSGSSVGARLRRWWYGVNNWPLPERAKAWEGRREIRINGSWRS